MVSLRVLLLLASLSLVACGGLGPPVAPGTDGALGPSGQDLDLELRALLLLLEDRGLFEPTVVAQSLASPRAETREALARALGRIDDPRGRDVLLELLADSAPGVRAAAATALAAHPSPAVVASLAAIAGGDDREAAVAAVAALARLGAALSDVLESLRGIEGDEVWQRIVPALFRFTAEERFEAASLALAEAPAELHRLAGLALAWRPPARAVPAVRELLGDQDPFLRAAAARALGAQGAAEDLSRLIRMLGDPEGAPVVAAIVALQSLVERGVAAPPPELVPALLARFDAVDASVRLAAIEASAAWLLDEELEAALDARFADPEAPAGDRAAALLAMARGGAPRAADRIADAASAPHPLLRAAAAHAAARLGGAALAGEIAAKIVSKLWVDPDPAVRSAALAAAFELEAEPSQLALEARNDPSAAVRGTLFELLGERPLLAHGDLVRPAGGDPLERERAPATRRQLVLALEARGRAERLERGAILETLERVAAGDPERPVRAAALSALEALGGEARAARSHPGRQELPAYRAMAALSAASVEDAVDVELVTERGRIAVRTDCRGAPKGCLSVLQLARQGFYDDQTIESLEPGVEVAFGDPSGTGFGDAGYRSLPESSALLPAEEGLLLLDCSSPAGCGSRLRLLLSPQPWLADEVVLVGRVTAGLDVARRLVPGDRLLEVVVSDDFPHGEAGRRDEHDARTGPAGPLPRAAG